jgi:acyl-CoA thioesterase
MERRALRDLAAAQAAFDRACRTPSQALGDFFLARLLGFQVRYEENVCVVEFDAEEFLQNPAGTLHGGVIATALDVAMGHLVQHLHGPAATLSMTIQYHRAVSKGRVRCIAHAVHRGASIWAMQASAYAESGELIASALSSFALRRSRRE